MTKTDPQVSHSATRQPAFNERQRVLYLDCYSGISGNMFFGAMLHLFDELGHTKVESQWRHALNALGLDDVEVTAQWVQKNGVRACFGDVAHHEHHSHRGLSEVLAVIARADLPANVSARATAIFTALAQAEAAVHDRSVEEIHFHEVGAIDAIIDVMSAAFFLEAVGARRIVASPVRTGQGLVHCAHGDMPIPAPATARLLRGVPTYAGEEAGEFTTPTGAAILAASVDAYGAQPAMTVLAEGYGAGSREAPWPNCLRAVLGEESAPDDVGERDRGNATQAVPNGVEVEELVEIECAVDDMRGDALAFLSDQLLAGPAVDVMFVAAVGKKSRPAHVVKVLVPPSAQQEALTLIFSQSTTLGARVRREQRLFLPREDVVIECEIGSIAAKRTRFDDVQRTRPEHDDLARCAKAHGLSLSQARQVFAVAAGDLGGPTKKPPLRD